MTKAELKNLFTFHPATEETGPRHDEVRKACLNLATKLTKLAPESPEQTLAIRKVQEAMFYANAAIAVHGQAAEAAKQG